MYHISDVYRFLYLVSISCTIVHQITIVIVIHHIIHYSGQIETP